MRGWIILALGVSLLFTGCMGAPQAGEEDQYSSMVGYVMDVDSAGRILVVDPVAQDFSDTGGIEEFYNAIWFSNAPQEVEPGNKVEVWFDIVAESYPGQSEALDIKIIQEEVPEGADLSPDQALNRLLTQEEVNRLVVVKSIRYQKEQDQWMILLKEILFEDSEVLEYTVEDK